MSASVMKKTKASDPKAAKSVRLSRERRIAILKALADPRRYELLERIAGAQDALSCSQVLEAIPIAPATLSHHIKELETAGIIETRRKGKFHFMSLRPGVLESLVSSLSTIGRKSPKS